MQVCEQLGHYFAGKAPATLLKRSNSMIYIMEQVHMLGYIFPYTEPELYALLKVLKQTGQTASRLKRAMEALTFCRYVFNIDSSFASIDCQQTLSWCNLEWAGESSKPSCSPKGAGLSEAA